MVYTVFSTMANTSPTPLLQCNNHFIFSLNSKPLPLLLHSLPLQKPLSPLTLSSSSSFPSSLSNHHAQCQSIPCVSVAPVEHAPPPPNFDFRREIARLRALRSKISVSKRVEEKDAVISHDARVKRFFNELNKKRGFGKDLASVGFDYGELFLVKCLVAAGQEHVLSLGYGEEFEEKEVNSSWSSMKSAFYALAEMIEGLDSGNDGGGDSRKQYSGVLDDENVSELRKLLKILAEVEKFYDCIGGIIGYQIMVLELLAQSRSHKTVNESLNCQLLEIHAPSGRDLSKNEEYASQAALWGIEGLPQLGEIYPLGGSADRLGFADPETGECLPAAMLPYCGRTLLEGLIRDLQAREFLYFKIHGKQCTIPVAIMTSAAKKNHERISSLCERLGWFGRGRSNFCLFEQPLVPSVSAEDGHWLVSKPFVPVCKPGGHGVIWKLAYDKGIFQWFYDHGRKGATVRQVSNVVAATDLTLLALAGIGLRHGKKLGFASCKRIVGATEGINVLLEKKNFDGKWAYGLSCIEYTEFEKFGITTGPPASSSLQEVFPANTNIMYVDLPSAELVGSRNDEKSLPGMVLNIKKAIVYADQYGDRHSVCGGRLECTMQNVADNFYNTLPSRCYQDVEDKLDTFIVYNDRRKVTSSAKKKRKQADKSLHQTPDGSLLDILRNAYDLLSPCDIKLPVIEGNDKYASSGPPYLILLHPALGPLWEVTRQKFHGGSVSKGSELQIEVAEFLWRNVQLSGSLIVMAENVMGSTKIDKGTEPRLQYGHRCGRCRLHNVKILNRGINWGYENNVYWKHDVQRFEVFKVILHGNAEFEASNVTLQGNHVFEVPNGYNMKVTSGIPDISVKLEPIDDNAMDTGTWNWKYKVHGSHVRLELVES